MSRLSIAGSHFDADCISGSWWAMNNSLEDFVYRINVSWWIFALAGIGALAIALLTVSS
ncbi:MAG: hypothetical protein IPJ74_25190 [Saprospiraceae bacterium]|nr:hypothetical protein [Saprospiraceae bacterium]